MALVMDVPPVFSRWIKMIRRWSSISDYLSTSEKNVCQTDNSPKIIPKMLNLLTILMLVVGVVWIFNPYLAHRWRSTKERWTTRQRSHGYPFYWMMRYGDKDSAYDHDADQCGCTPAVSCGAKTCTSMHRRLYNRPSKAECNVKNIIYIE